MLKVRSPTFSLVLYQRKWRKNWVHPRLYTRYSAIFLHFENEIPLFMQYIILFSAKISSIHCFISHGCVFWKLLLWKFIKTEIHLIEKSRADHWGRVFSSMLAFVIFWWEIEFFFCLFSMYEPYDVIVIWAINIWKSNFSHAKSNQSCARLLQSLSSTIFLLDEEKQFN